MAPLELDGSGTQARYTASPAGTAPSVSVDGVGGESGVDLGFQNLQQLQCVVEFLLVMSTLEGDRFGMVDPGVNRIVERLGRGRTQFGQS